MTRFRIMALKWLDDNAEAASKGINLVVSKVFKSVGSEERLGLLKMINPDAKSFSELKKKMAAHPSALSRNLKILQEYGLAAKHPKGYIITTLGSIMLSFAKEIEKGF